MKENTHKQLIIRRRTAKVQQKINKSGKCLFLTWKMMVLCERTPGSQMSIRCWAGGAVVLSFLCADSGPGARFSELLGSSRACARGDAAFRCLRQRWARAAEGERSETKPQPTVYSLYQTVTHHYPYISQRRKSLWLRHQLSNGARESLFSQAATLTGATWLGLSEGLAAATGPGRHLVPALSEV